MYTDTHTHTYSDLLINTQRHIELLTRKRRRYKCNFHHNVATASMQQINTLTRNL